MGFVDITITQLSDELPCVRVTVRGTGGTRAILANGAVPWHASPVMRGAARELADLADHLDRLFPQP